jgi:DNA-directed RNA polymerase subunit RPC12/RpoP
MRGYEFHCRTCERDLALALTERDLVRKAYRCPHCHGKELERIPDREPAELRG